MRTRVLGFRERVCACAVLCARAWVQAAAAKAGRMRARPDAPLVAQAQSLAALGDGPAPALLSVLLRHGYDPNQQVSLRVCVRACARLCVRACVRHCMRARCRVATVCMRGMRR